MAKQKRIKLKRIRWLHLDNAGKIYPAVSRKTWSAVFRMSITLREEVDMPVLEQALESVLKRFPTFGMRLKSGLFWYYFESIEGAPPITEDYAYPCTRLLPNQNAGFNFRVLTHKNRIAVEIFHALTDGTGGMTFIKTLTAEYLRLKHGANIPRDAGILDCGTVQNKQEIEDSFTVHAGKMPMGRYEENAYRIKGKREPDGFLNVTLATIPLEACLALAREKKASLTVLLTALLILAIIDVARQDEAYTPWKLRPVKITVPINLRRFFKSSTLRNFSSFINPGVDPRLGEYTLEEVIYAVHHFMQGELTEKRLKSRFTANVMPEKLLIVRVMPLFVKNIVMKIVFNNIGEKKCTSTLSNLGSVVLPEEMACYVETMDWTLGPLSKNPVACTVLSFRDKLKICITRTLVEPKVERAFLTRLVKMGVPVHVESNQR